MYAARTALVPSLHALVTPSSIATVPAGSPAPPDALAPLCLHAVRRRLPEHFYTHDPATGTQLVRHSE